MNDERQRKLQAGRERLRAYQRKKKTKKTEHDSADAGDTSDTSQASDASQLFDSDSASIGLADEHVAQQQRQHDESDASSACSVTGGSSDERGGVEEEHSKWYADRLSDLEERLLGKEDAIRSLADEASGSAVRIQDLEHQLEGKDALIRQIGDQYAHNVGLLEERIHGLQEQLQQASNALLSGSGSGGSSGSGRRSPAEAAAAVAQSVQETKEEVRAMRRDLEQAARQRDDAVALAHDLEQALRQRDASLLDLERRMQARAADAERLASEVERLTGELGEREATMQALAGKLATRAQDLSEATENLRLATERESASAKVVLQLQRELERHGGVRGGAATVGDLAGGWQVMTLTEHQQKLEALRAELDEQHGLQIAQLMSALASEKASTGGDRRTAVADVPSEHESALSQRLAAVVQENERLVAQVQHWEGWYKAAQEQMALQHQQQMLAYAESLRTELQAAHFLNVQSIMAAREDEVKALGGHLRELEAERDAAVAAAAAIRQPPIAVGEHDAVDAGRGDTASASKSIDDDERSMYLSKIAALQMQIEDLISPVGAPVVAGQPAVLDASLEAMYEDQVAHLREQLDAVRARLLESDRQHQLLLAELDSMRAAAAAAAAPAVATADNTEPKLAAVMADGSAQTSGDDGRIVVSGIAAEISSEHAAVSGQQEQDQEKDHLDAVVAEDLSAVDSGEVERPNTTGHPGAPDEGHREDETAAASDEAGGHAAALRRLERELAEEREARQRLLDECAALAASRSSWQSDTERLSAAAQAHADENTALASQLMDVQAQLQRCEAILAALSLARDSLVDEAADLGRRLAAEHEAGERLQRDLADAQAQLRSAADAAADAASLREQLADAEERLRQAGERARAADAVSSSVQEAFAAQLAQSEAERDELRRRLDELRAERERAAEESAGRERSALDELRAELRAAVAEREDAEVELVKRRAELDAVAHRAQALDEALAAANRRVAELESHCSAVEAELGDVRGIADAAREERERLQAQLGSAVERWMQKERDDKAELAELRRRRHDDVEALEEAAQQRLEAAVADARSEAEQRLAAALAERESELTRLADERVVAAREACAAEAELLKEQHAQELAELRREWETRLADAAAALQSEHRAQLLAVKEINEREWQREVAAIMETHGKDLEAVRADLDAAQLESLHELREKLDRAHKDDAAVQLLQYQHEGKLQLESVKLVMHQVYMAQLESTRAELEQLSESRLAELAERHRAELCGVERSCSERLAELEAGRDQIIQRLTAEFESKKQDLLAKLSGDQESVIAAWSRRVDELEQELVTLKAAARLDLEGKEREIAELQLDREQLLKMAEESRERLGKVHSEEIADLQQQLQLQYDAAISHLKESARLELSAAAHLYEQRIGELRVDVGQLQAALATGVEQRQQEQQQHERELDELRQRLEQQQLELQRLVDQATRHVTEATQQRESDAGIGERPVLAGADGLQVVEEAVLEERQSAVQMMLGSSVDSDDGAGETPAVAVVTADLGGIMPSSTNDEVVEEVPLSAHAAEPTSGTPTLGPSCESGNAVPLEPEEASDHVEPSASLPPPPLSEPHHLTAEQREQLVAATVEREVATRLDEVLAEQRLAHSIEIADVERSLSERHAAELRSIREQVDAEHEAELARLIESWQRTVSDVRAECDALVQRATAEAAERHSRALDEAVLAARAECAATAGERAEEARVELERRLAALESEWAQRVERLEQERDEAASRLGRERDEQLLRLAGEHERQLEQQRSEHDERMRTLVAEHRAAAERASVERDERVAELLDKQRLERDGLSRRLEAAEEELRAVRRGLDTGEAPEIAQLKETLRAQFESEVLIMKSTMKEEFDEVTRNMQEQAVRRLEAEQTAFIERHNRMVEKFTAEREQEAEEAGGQARAALEQQRRALAAEHEAELARLAQEQREREELTRAEQELARAELLAAHDQLVRAEREEHDGRLRDLRGQHDQELQKLRSDHALEAARIADTVKEEVLKEHSARLDVLMQDLAQSHEARLRELGDRLDAHYSEKLRASDEASRSALEQRDGQIAELRLILEAEQQRASVELAAAVETLDKDWRQRAAAGEQRLRSELDAAHAEELAQAHRATLEEGERARGELVQQHQRDVDAMRKQCEETLAVWQRNMSELMAEQSSIRQENVQRLDGLRHEHEQRMHELQRSTEQLLHDFAAKDAELAEAKSTLLRTTAELEAERSGSAAELGRLQQDLRDRGTVIDRLQADAERLTAQRATLMHNQRLFVDLLGRIAKSNAGVEERVALLLGESTSLLQPTSAAAPDLQDEAAAAQRKPASRPASATATGDDRTVRPDEEQRDAASDELQREHVIMLVDDLEGSSRRAADSMEHALGALERSVTQLVEAHRVREELAAEVRRGRTALEALEERSAAADAQVRELAEQMAADADARRHLEVEMHKARGLLEGHAAERERQEETIRALESKRAALAVSCEQLGDRVRQLEEQRGESEAAQLCAQRQQEAMALAGSQAETGESVASEHAHAPGQTLLRQNSQLDRDMRDMRRQFEHEQEELLRRLHEAEQKAESTSRECDRLAECHAAERHDLLLQVEAAERQLKASKAFIEEQTTERELEREQSLRYAQQCQSVADEKRRLEVAVSELQSQVSDLRASQQLTDTRSTEDADTAVVSALRMEVSETRDLMRILRVELDAKDVTIKKLQEKLATLRTEVGTAASAMDSIERKDAEISSLVEQLEGFREQLLEKTEQLQQMSLQLEVSNHAAAYTKSELEGRLQRLQEDVYRLQAEPTVQQREAAADTGARATLVRSETARAVEEPPVEARQAEAMQLASSDAAAATITASAADGRSALGALQGEEEEAEEEEAEEEEDDDDMGRLRVRLAEREALAEEYALRLQAQRTEIESLAEFQAKLQDDFDAVAGMLEAKEAEIDRLSRLLADAEHAAEAKASLDSVVAELRRAIKEKDNVINEKEEDMYTQNEELQKSVQLKASLEADLQRHRMELAERDMLVAALRHQISTAVGVARTAGSVGGGDAEDNLMAVEGSSSAEDSSSASAKEASAVVDQLQAQEQHLRGELELSRLALSEAKAELQQLAADCDAKVQAAVLEAEEEFGIRLDMAEVDHSRALLELEERHEKELATALDRLKEQLGDGRAQRAARGASAVERPAEDDSHAEAALDASVSCSDSRPPAEDGLSAAAAKSTSSFHEASLTSSSSSHQAAAAARTSPQHPRVAASSSLQQRSGASSGDGQRRLNRIGDAARAAAAEQGGSGGLDDDGDDDELQQLLDSVRSRGSEILTLSEPSRQPQQQQSRQQQWQSQPRQQQPSTRVKLSYDDDDDDDYEDALLSSAKRASSARSARRLPAAGSGSWADERHALFTAIDTMKDVLAEADSSSGGLSLLTDLTLTDWRAQLLRSFIRLFAKERLVLLSELRSLTAGMTAPASGDAAAAASASSASSPRGGASAQWWQQRLEWLERSAMSQAALQAETIDTLLAADRQSLLSEARELRVHIGVSQAQHASVLKQLREEMEAREERSTMQLRSLRAQLELLEYKLTQERVVAEDLRTSFDNEHQRLMAQSAELDNFKDANMELGLSLAAVQAEAVRLKEAVEWRDQQLSTAREQMDSAKRFYDDERAKTERLMELLHKEQSVHEELKEQANDSHKRALAAHALATEKLRAELEAERGRCVDVAAALEREKLAAAMARRELDGARADWERLERKLRDSASDLRESLEAEKAKCASLSSAIQRERQQVEQLQEKLSGERQRRAAAAAATTSAATSPRPSSELERRQAAALELEAERGRCLDLQSAVEREKSRANAASAALDAERLLLSEELDRERASCRQLKKTLDIVENRCQELQRQLLHEKAKADQLQESLDALHRSMAEAEAKEAQRDALRERQRFTEQQRIAREREDYRHHKGDAELQNQRLRRQVVELQLQLAQREHSHAVEHRDLMLLRHNTASPPPLSPSPSPRGTRTASPLLHHQHPHAAAARMPLDFQDSIAGGGRPLSPSASSSGLRLDGGSAAAWWRQLELLRQRLHLIAVQLQELSCDSDGILDAIFDDLRHMQHVFAAAPPSESDIASTPLLSSVDGVLRHNTQLTSYLAKLSADKLELRGALSRLAAAGDSQVSSRRLQPTSPFAATPMSRYEHSGSPPADDAGGASAREKWMLERASLVRAVEEAEGKAIRARRDQRLAEAKLSACQAAAADLSTLSNGSARGNGSSPHDKLQKVYGKYLRAESFRKALVYQKKYLLLLLGGFQETEALTLQSISKPDHQRQPSGLLQTGSLGPSISPKARFRSAARTVVAISRMKFLVRKWQKAVARVPGTSRVDDRTTSSLSHDGTIIAALPRHSGGRHQPEGAARQQHSGGSGTRAATATPSSVPVAADRGSMQSQRQPWSGRSDNGSTEIPTNRKTPADAASYSGSAHHITRMPVADGSGRQADAQALPRRGSASGSVAIAPGSNSAGAASSQAVFASVEEAADLSGLRQHVGVFPAASHLSTSRPVGVSGGSSDGRWDSRDQVRSAHYGNEGSAVGRGTSEPEQASGTPVQNGRQELHNTMSDVPHDHSTQSLGTTSAAAKLPSWTT